MNTIHGSGTAERLLPLYVVRVRAKGKAYLYFRFKGLYRRLPDDERSDEFKREYAKAFASVSPDIENPIIHHSVRALIRDFKTSPEYNRLAPKTQADYGRVLDYLAPYGDFQADNLRRQHVILARNHIGKNTRTQDLFVQAVSRMFSIGIDLGYTDRNPAARIERLNDPESYEPWDTEDHRRFRASGLPPWMMTAYMLGVWTAQREGDILRLARARYDGAGFTIRQGRPEAKRGKGRKGEVVRLYITAAKPLREYLARCTFPGLLFVTDDAGKPIPPTEFRHKLREHLNGIGLTDRHFHGLRHTTATALAELGGSDAEIQALLGHQTRQMAERYTKKARQRSLAGSAVKKLEEGWDIE
jgi:integrase